MVGIGYYHNFFSPLPLVSQRPNGAFLKLRTQAETYTKTKTKMAADTENEEISLKKRMKWKQPIKQHTKWNTGERNRERERERERERPEGSLEVLWCDFLVWDLAEAADIFLLTPAISHNLHHFFYTTIYTRPAPNPPHKISQCLSKFSAEFKSG